MEQEERAAQPEQALKEGLAKYNELLGGIAGTIRNYSEGAKEVTWIEYPETGGENPGQRTCRKGRK